MGGFDVARVRGLYSAIGSGTAHLEGALAAVQPQTVVSSVIAALRAGPAQPGSRSVRSRHGARAVLQTRQAIADLVGGRPADVVLGSSLTDLLLRLIGSLSADWQLGDELVLSRLDSDLQLQGWRRMARERGAIIRWAEVDLETGELPAWQYERLIGARTRIVTVPLGNPTTGTVPDIAKIAARAHEHGALVVADAGVALNHLPLDLDELGADVLSLSAASFGGPTVAAFAARPGLLEELDVPLVSLEPGPLPVELLDGVVAAVDHLAMLDETATGSRRDRLTQSVTAAGQHTAGLFATLHAGLLAIDGVTVIGTSTDRLPVVAFLVHGHTAEQVADALNVRRIAVWSGPAHVSELLSVIGADEVGGIVHVGLMPHTNAAEVNRLLDAVANL